MTQKWTTEYMPSLAGQRAVVTGANSGLGLETTVALAAHGVEVVMACRSRDKTESAMATIRARAPGAKLSFVALDLADLESVRSCAAGLQGRFDLLVNNAGVMALPLKRTRQNFEMQIGTNHLGHFAFTGLVLERLAPTARIVSVASMAHRWTLGINFDDLNFERSRYNKWDAYGKSKLANLLFTFELHRRLRAAGRGQLAVAAHPGYSVSNLGYAGPSMTGSTLERLTMDIGNALFAQDTAMGALPSLYAASAPDVKSGDYIGAGGFREMRGYPKRVGCSRAARDEGSAQRLWELSEQLTGVRYLD
jgi:NAD(P)-dependent dehydrogenase (short-subunit alcohol dehydrogenase family)